MGVTEALTNQLIECADKKDFDGAFKLVRENREELAKSLSPAGVQDALKKTTNDRLLLSFLDGAGFNERPFDKALVALEKLVSFKEGALVLSKAWGIGKVKRLDYFYKRITVDFKTKRGHQFAYAAAVDMLVVPPEDHILVFREADPSAFEKLLATDKAEFVKRVLKSYGDMTITRLEDICIANGFVKKENWKKFWDSARGALKSDKLVEIPAKRADPIRLKAAAEDYGDSWLMAFTHETDPKLILASVQEYGAQGKLKEGVLTDDVRAKIGERLAFAVTAARKVDDALYARLAVMVTNLKFTTPAAEEMRAYLWERKRFIKAAAALPAREVGAMIDFLASDDEAKAKLYAAVPEFCFAAVSAIVEKFIDETTKDAEGNVTGYPCRAALGALLKESNAPATLVTYIIGKVERFVVETKEMVDIGDKTVEYVKHATWDEFPALTTILTHAIALGEGRRNGETLKMQNIVRRLFADSKWLEKIFKYLTDAERALIFERFQASIAWDPSSHHMTVVRMTHLDASLEKHVVKAEKKKEYDRLTSYRSFATRKAEYLKLINEDMPENVRKIEFAKGFGDLSENAEYQYAKDEQRQLMQKQSLMQADLEAVKPSDFADATTDEVMPGVAVVIATPEGEKTYSILGEWDNDLDQGIISFKTRLAQNMLGKKAGDQFEMPSVDGPVSFGTVKEIKPLTDSVREWMKLPAGLQI